MRLGAAVRDGVYIPIGGKGTKGLYPGSAIVTSRHLHLYVMVVLSGARVVRALCECEAAPC